MKPTPAHKAATFVCEIWSRAGGVGYGSIQVKNQRGMSSKFFSLPADVDEVSGFLKTTHVGADIYFCPLPSNQRSRKKGAFNRSRLLWADLDEVSPKCKPEPTVAWETSPGRYQSLWFLDKSLPTSQIEIINRNLSYSIGADKGGWDLGQILRIPHTINYKPAYDQPRIRLLWNRDFTIPSSKVHKFLKKHEAQPKRHSIISPPVEINKTLLDQWIHWKRIPEGKRSEKPHAWAWGLLSKGLSPEWVLRAVSEHPLTVEKYGDRAEAEVQRSIDKWDDKKPAQPITEWSSPEIIPATDFLGIQHEVRWMQKDIWMEDTVGIIDGPPKTFKTWVSFDLGVSVASQSAFMGQKEFKWQASQDFRNDVLIIQEEDPRVVIARRLGKILESKGFDAGGFKKSSAVVLKGQEIVLRTGDPIPLHIATGSGFRLDQKEYIDWLEESISLLNLRLVIIDPLLVVLGEVDEFKAGEVIAALQPLKLLRDRYNCSFCIVHHTHIISPKGDMRRPGQQLYGGTGPHAWLESALHVREIGNVEETRTVEIHREFKAAPPGDPLYIHFPSMDDKYCPEIKSQEDVQKEKRERKSERGEKDKEERLKDEISAVYTYIRKNGPVSGQILQDEMGW